MVIQEIGFNFKHFLKLNTSFYSKPQYSLANEVPLILYNCKFNDITVQPTGLPYSEAMEIERTTTAGRKDVTEWVYDEKSIADVLTDLQKSWSANQIKYVYAL